MNNFATNLHATISGPAFVLNTPSLVVAGAELVPEEIVRDLLDQAWVETSRDPKPLIVIPTDVPRSPRAASSRTRADTITVTNSGESEQYRGHMQELVDTETTITLRIIVSARGGRQRMHNLKRTCRDILYRYRRVLAPYHRVHVDGFSPDYEAVNVHAGDMQIRLLQFAVPLFTRRTAQQETPSTDPAQFPQGLRV